MTTRLPFLLLAASTLASGALAQNDECAMATTIAVGVTPYDTTAATLSATTWNCAGGGGPDLWYSFTASSDSVHTFDLCGSTYDAALEAYDGTCAALNLIDCNDDYCGLQSSISIAMNTGDQVFLRVGGWSGSFGMGTLTVTNPPPPSGSPSAWEAEANAGTMPTFTAINVDIPTSMDIGSPIGASAVTYEFVVFGDNTNSSSALMGNLGTGAGNSAALKFEQWSNTLQYGVTQFGVLDHSFGAPNTEQTDIHLVFIADINAASTELFVDGVSVGTVPYAPVFQGIQGIGQADRPGSHVDEMGRGRIRGVAVYDGALPMAEILAHRDAYFSGNLGTPYCSPAVANSSGNPATINGSGSVEVAANMLTLECSDMPQNAFAFFLTSQSQGLVMMPGGSQGNLCLTGAIGRFVGAGQIQNSGSAGEVSLLLNLSQHPTPTGLVQVQAGETWNFTCWFRDAVSGSATSNFSNGVSMTFN